MLKRNNFIVFCKYSRSEFDACDTFQKGLDTCMFTTVSTFSFVFVFDNWRHLFFKFWRLNSFQFLLDIWINLLNGAGSLLLYVSALMLPLQMCKLPMAWALMPWFQQARLQYVLAATMFGSILHKGFRLFCHPVLFCFCLVLLQWVSMYVKIFSFAVCFDLICNQKSGQGGLFFNWLDSLCHSGVWITVFFNR